MKQLGMRVDKAMAGAATCFYNSTTLGLIPINMWERFMRSDLGFAVAGTRLASRRTNGLWSKPRSDWTAGCTGVGFPRKTCGECSGKCTRNVPIILGGDFEMRDRRT